MSWLVAEQVRRNQASQNRWHAFAGHRRQVTARLLGSASCISHSLCVLGAGNSNDLDLESLTKAFGEVHLVDVDGEALEYGVACQREADRGVIRLHGGTDVTGCWDPLSDWTSPIRPTDSEIEIVMARISSGAALALPAPFDVVLSACLVSQLIEAVTKSLGAEHPRLLEMILAVRTAHLRLLTGLVANGGRGMLVTDFVSSDTLPELLGGDEPDWPALLPRVTENRNFFHGLNPFVLLSLFKTDPVLSTLVAEPRITGFWRWDQAPRVYAVCAIEFRRTAMASGGR